MKIEHKKRGRHPKPALKLGIDCGSLSTIEGERSGVGTITANLIRELVRQGEKNTYILYSFQPLKKELWDNSKDRIRNKVLPRFGYKSLWLRLALWWDKPHVFLATAQATPQTHMPVLGFIYDLAFLKYPKLYDNFTRLKKNTDTLVQIARHIITISESSHNAILKEYAVSNETISTVYPGVASTFSPEGSKYIDTCPYFLYVGALKKTKNIPQILKAFHSFLSQTEKKYKLVLVGNTKEMDPAISQMITSLDLTDMVVIKPDVATEDIAKYYRGALAFVSPALWEGFGLPLLEAMNSGTPVIAARISAMTEVVGKAGILVDPQNTKEITKAFVDIAANDTFRKNLSAKGLKRAKGFRWEIFAKEVLSVVYKYCIK